MYSRLKKKMSIMLLVVFLLVAMSFALTSPIHSSNAQPVGEGKRGGMLDQHEPLQAYSYSEPPEAEWNKTYGRADWDEAQSVVQTSDGGYALAGFTDSFGAEEADFRLIKLAPEEAGVDWWPTFHHDQGHTGYSTSTAPNTNNTIWSYTTGDWVWSSPAVADGKVFIGSGDGNVYSLNGYNGAHVWNYTIGYSIDSSPAVADGKVYMGSRDDKVYCLDASTGAHIWNFTTDSWVYSSPAVVDGKVYVGSEDYKVYCLDASTGAHVWNFTTGYYVDSSPAVADGKVYVGSWDGKVYCLDASTGAHVWNFTTGDLVYSSPAVADGKVYVGSYDGKVYAFGPPTHDVAVTNITPSKTIVGQGYSTSINVTVENQGGYTETFNVTTYYNSNVINYTTVANLPSGEETTVTFTWDTTGVAKGNYTITAKATQLPGETDTTDNTLTNGWIIVSMVGDITGLTPNPYDFVPDGVVDGSDLLVVTRGFGSYPGIPVGPEYPIWHVNADVNGDGVIDADDLIIITRHFGEADP